MSSSSPRWPRPIVVLHWASLLVLLLALSAIVWRDQVEDRALRALLLALHRHAGLLLLALGALRLLARARWRQRPPVQGGAPARWAAVAVHLLLYGALLGVPLLGWALSDARGQPWQAFGLSWPALATADEDLADDLQAWHALAALTTLGLVALHAAAAFWHHWVLRDDTLRAMR
jgi:cytochrome b561